MATEPKPASDDLFGTDGAESQTDAASNTESGEESKEGQEAQSDAAERNRAAKIASFQRRVANGEMTIDQITEDWVRKAVSEAKPKEIDVSEAAIEKVLEKREDAKLYATLKAKVAEANLSDSQRAKLSKEFDELVSYKLPLGRALEKAISGTGTKLEDASRQAARIPRPSTRKTEDKTETVKQRLADGEVPTDIPLDDRIAAYEALRKANGGR